MDAFQRYQDQIDDVGQLELLLTLGARHKEMGMQRKAAFYFRRAALLRWRTFGQDDVAHCMLVQIADVYGLDGMVDFLNGDDGVSALHNDRTTRSAQQGLLNKGCSTRGSQIFFILTGFQNTIKGARELFLEWCSASERAHSK